MPSPTPRERVLQALRHTQPDRVPWHFTFTAPARRKLEAYLGTTNLDDALNNHLARYRPLAPTAWCEVQPGFWRDEFGVVWNRTVDEDIGVVENNQLPARSLADYRFPDPHDPQRFAGLSAFLSANSHRFCYVSLAYSLFERAWTLRHAAADDGYAGVPEFVDELLDAITAFQCGILEEALKYPIDGVRFGDDWGHQRGLLFGRPLWQRFIKPRIARMYGMVKRAGKAVMIHSCGKVQELFPELIEIGLDIFNPFQPEVMDPLAIKKQFGSSLSFFGGVSVQRLLPHGTPQQIRDQVRLLIDQVGQGGGFIIGPSHDMPGDIPVENMAAFVQAVMAD